MIDALGVAISVFYDGAIGAQDIAVAAPMTGLEILRLGLRQLRPGTARHSGRIGIGVAADADKIALIVGIEGRQNTLGPEDLHALAGIPHIPAEMPVGRDIGIGLRRPRY